MPGMPIESEGRSGWESSRAYRVAHLEDDMVMGAETRGRIEETLLAEANRSCCAAIAMIKARTCRSVLSARDDGITGRSYRPSWGLLLT